MTSTVGVNLRPCCACVAWRVSRLQSLVFTQGGGGAAGPAEGDAKALGLMAEMETGDWGQGRLTEADRTGAVPFVFTFG